MKGVFIPTPSPYDISPSAPSQTSALVGDVVKQTESHLLIGGPMDTVNDKQVRGLICLEGLSVSVTS